MENDKEVQPEKRSTYGNYALAAGIEVPTVHRARREREDARRYRFLILSFSILTFTGVMFLIVYIIVQAGFR